MAGHVYVLLASSTILRHPVVCRVELVNTRTLGVCKVVALISSPLPLTTLRSAPLHAFVSLNSWMLIPLILLQTALNVLLE